MSRLIELDIRSLGVIDHGVLEFGEGFTAITGETGAGKTMVVQALALLRGARTDAGVIRAGDERAAVQAVWHVDDGAAIALVEDAGGEVDAGELIVGRSLPRTGRSKASAGGAQVPAGVLQGLADRLVAVHGQSDQQRLVSRTAQLEALDRATGPEFAGLLDDYRASLHAWRAAIAQRDAVLAAKDEREREAQRLRDALELLEQLDAQPGEDVELQALATRLEHTESLRSAVGEAHANLAGEFDAADAVSFLGAARRLLERGVESDDSLRGQLEQLVDAEAIAQDVAAELARYLDALDTPERSLDEVHERRAAIAAACRRLGVGAEDLAAFGSEAAARLAELDDDEALTESLDEAIAEHGRRATELADQLSELRSAAATALEHAGQDELRALAMPDARLRIEVTAGDDLGESGRDTVQLLLAPHPGAAFRPIAKGASGGELSRVMLALEVALAAGDVPTFVFDEVDAGVGGASAVEIGARLARLAEHAQVIVVTHLAQVAAFADRQLRIRKDTDGQVTASSIESVDGDARVRELARMLAGSDSDTALAHAEELLANSAARRSPDGRS